MTKTPRIYAACLASYYSDQEHGRWIDVTTPEAVMDEVRAMLAASPEPNAEEWAIHDYKGFGNIFIQPDASFAGAVENICELAKFIVEYGKSGIDVLNQLRRQNMGGNNLDEAREVLENLVKP